MFKPANKKSKVLRTTAFWSSSEYSAIGAYGIDTNYGYINGNFKWGYDSVRSFIALV